MKDEENKPASLVPHRHDNKAAVVSLIKALTSLSLSDRSYYQLEALNGDGAVSMAAFGWWLAAQVLTQQQGKSGGGGCLVVVCCSRDIPVPPGSLSSTPRISHS